MKTPQDNMKPKKVQSKAVSRSTEDLLHWTQTYTDSYAMIDRPIPEIYIKKLALDLVEWATKSERPVRIPQFLEQRRISKSSYEKWRVAYPFLQQAHDFARMCLANRREVNALERTWDAKTALEMMPYYCDDWKEMIKWKHGLANEVPQQQQFKPLTAIELGDGTIIRLGVKDDDSNGQK